MTAVRLHIYDVTTSPVIEKINKGLTAVGTGAFHGGVEIFSEEWSYGYTPDGSGVFPGPPMQCTMHHYRESVELGSCSMSKAEVMQIIEKMKGEWPGSDYDLLRKNCVEFSKAFAVALGVAAAFPDWVTNLAGAGATLQDGFMTTATQAQAMAIIAKAKAKEIDKQYEVKGQAKASFKAMIDASKQLDAKHDIQGNTKLAASKTSEGLTQGSTLMMMKASEMDGTYKITEKSKAKWNEMNEKHKIAEKAGKAVTKGQELLGTGVAALQAKMTGGQAGGSAGGGGQVDSAGAPKKDAGCCQG